MKVQEGFRYFYGSLNQNNTQSLLQIKTSNLEW